MSSESAFRETQRVDGRWVWIAVGAATIAAIASLQVLGVLIGACVVGFIRATRLRTEVRDDGVYVRFAPLQRSFRRIPFAEIGDCERTEVSAVAYGGVGIRWLPGTIAYLVSSGEGVAITRLGDHNVVIGSQRSRELAAAIEEQGY